MKMNSKHFMFLITFILCLANIFEQFIGMFQYADELIALLMVAVICMYAMKRPVAKDMFINICLVVLLIVIGLISSTVAGLQTNKVAISTDILTMFKFVPLFWGSVLLNSSVNRHDKIWRWLSFVSRVFVLVGFVCCIVNLFVNINMYTDIRYGIRAFNFVYSRVGGLYNACAIFLTIQLMDIYFNGNSKWKERFLLITCILMVSTLRTRAFVYAAVFLFGYYFIMKKKKIHFKWWQIGVAAVLVVALSYGQLRYYFIDNDTQARFVLLKYGIQTAINYFPLGSGFATYGTNPAKTYWSSLYNSYGFSNYYGLGKVNTAYLTDTYWPAIMAELGFIGAILMAVLIITMFRFIHKSTKRMVIPWFAGVYLYGVTVLSSTATASFMTGSTKIFIIGMIVGEVMKQKNKVGSIP